ncbi:MAG: 1-acyl-sn-glycerol-3-phosphate acyltransferase [Gemmatimonadales bacterium]|nr:MAG: 1-acyl-sn-glycerol-3-phosphate acyltransferase [Gemmatimonadales bacterium]
MHENSSWPSWPFSSVPSYRRYSVCCYCESRPPKWIRMRRFLLGVGNGAVWLVWLLIIIAWCPVVAVVFLCTAWWDERRWYTGRIFRFGTRLLVGVNPWWSVTVEGTLPPRSSEPFVAVCNHESMADILLVGTLPFDMKWLSKSQIARIPLLGWMMWMAGDIVVKRTDARSRGQSFDRMVTWIQRGASIMIFPEGTRTRTGDLLPFRNGAFRLALETGRPIQPLAVSGTRQAIQADSALFGRANVTVRILEQVTVEGMGLDDVDELRHQVRSMIAAARDV